MPEPQPTPKPKIAFHTVLTSNEPAIGNKIVKFQQTSLDTANAYNSADGIYIVPETGIYVFTWTMISHVHSIVSSELLINSNVAGKTLADSDENGDYHTSTGITVASVMQGDHVFVQFVAGYVKGSVETSTGHTTFSGWKLN